MRINPDVDVWLDLNEFENKLGEAKLEDAINLYKGEFLEGFHVRDSEISMFGSDMPSNSYRQTLDQPEK